MKRIVALLLIAVLMVGLAACLVWQPYETTVAGISLQVNPLKRTLTHGENQYEYRRKGEEIWITYPNGDSYIWDLKTKNDSWNGSQDTEKQYIRGAVLTGALPENIKEESRSRIVVVSTIFGLMGLWHVLLPRKSLFMLAYGWGVWKGEESFRNINGIRTVGAVMVIVALFCIILAW